MTIDRAVAKFDNLLEDVPKIMPLTMLKDGSICYDNYIIKKNSNNKWDLSQFNKRYKNFIGSFNIKSTALIAANHHKHNRVMALARTKDLDQRYWANYIDSINFRKLYKNTDETIKRDVFLWRWELSRDRADNLKDEITFTFNQAFR